MENSFTVRALPTKYNGITFRSRLEARWAVFFDELRLEWEYEREGYDLGGIWYLPDFWLVDVNMWAEVKPVEFSPEENELARQLNLGTGFPVLCLVGAPADKPYEAWAFYSFGDFTVEKNTYSMTNYHGYPKDEHRFFSGSPDDMRWDDTAQAAKIARNKKFTQRY